MCGWAYQGKVSVANGCTHDASGKHDDWDCSGAADYQRNGECIDAVELLTEAATAAAAAAAAGLGVAAVTPRHELCGV